MQTYIFQKPLNKISVDPTAGLSMFFAVSRDVIFPAGLGVMITAGLNVIFKADHDVIMTSGLDSTSTAIADVIVTVARNVGCSC